MARCHAAPAQDPTGRFPPLKELVQEYESALLRLTRDTELGQAAIAILDVMTAEASLKARGWLHWRPARACM
jgi:hypothetical protein